MKQTDASVPMALQTDAEPDIWAGADEPAAKTPPQHYGVDLRRPVPAIYGAMSAVMDEIGILTPDATGPTQHQSYPYLSIEKLVGNLRPLLVKHGIVIESKVLHAIEEVTFAQAEPLIVRDKAAEGVLLESSYWRGSVPNSRTRAHVIVEFSFISAEDGSRMVSSSTASSADTGDKALRKAMSTVFKQTLLHTFAIASKEPEVDGSDIEEEQEKAAARATARDHGAQKRDRARGQTTPRAKAAPAEPAPAPAPVMAAPAGATEPLPGDEAIQAAEDASIAATMEPEQAAAPVEEAQPEPESKDALAAAKKAFREATGRRNKGGAAMTMVEIDALGEKITGKKREDWLKSAAAIKKITAAIEAGEVA